MEADFQSCYSLDLRAALRDFGMRRIRALVKGLPPGSAFHRSIDPEWWSWDGQHELLAVIAELLDGANRMYLMAHSKKGAAKPQPIKIPRPYSPKPKESGMSVSDAIRKFPKRVKRGPSDAH